MDCNSRYRLILVNGTFMLWWNDVGEWFILSCKPASKMVSAWNATVNHGQAVAPYVPYLKTN